MTDSAQTLMTIEVSDQSLSADFSTRVVRGLVLPWDEMAQGTSSTQTPPLSFPRGSVTLPADFSALNANLFHNKNYPVARFTALEDTERGIEAEFAISATPEGDQLLRDVAAGTMRSISAEVRDLVRDGVKAVSAFLTGASFVPKGAFQSAALFALAEEEPVTEDTPSDSLAIEVEALPETITATTPEGETAVYEPTPEIPESDEDTLTETPEETRPMADFATLPEGVGSSAPAAKADTSAPALFSQLARLNNTGTPVSADFALADITGAQIGSDIEQPQWLGEVYAERTYTQKVLPLFGHADLRSFTVTGFRWTKTPEVGLYSGNKTEIPSDTVDTEPYSVTAQRIAGGHDIDRRFRDFGNEAFWDGYFRHMASSYAKVADEYVFNLIEDAADANVVTVDDEGVTDPFAWIVDAALQVEENGATPTFALVAPSVYRSIIQKPKDQTLEYFNSAFGLTEGNFGGFRVIPHAGVAAAGHKAIVGSRDAATVYELPGSPIRVEGIDVARAGIDPALYGYIALTVNKPDALVVIDGDAA